MKFFTLIITLLIFQTSYVFAPPTANAKSGVNSKEWKNPKPFDKWLIELREEAVSKDISKETLDNALANIKLLKVVIKLDRKQPEGSITLEKYLQRVVTSSRIRNGRRELAKNKKLLTKISKQYSVPTNVIVALWGIETSYGENTGRLNVINSLATLAYDGRRSDFFRKELINAFRIMDTEEIPAEAFDGSWAGAFGQCQFMPSSFLKYAVDFDDDGKRDIWFTQDDIFASIANYLNSEGWDSEKTIKKDNNNFKVLLKWNRSSYFATAVGKLAKAIGE